MDCALCMMVCHAFVYPVEWTPSEKDATTSLAASLADACSPTEQQASSSSSPSGQQVLHGWGGQTPSSVAGGGQGGGQQCASQQRVAAAAGMLGGGALKGGMVSALPAEKTSLVPHAGKLAGAMSMDSRLPRRRAVSVACWGGQTPSNVAGGGQGGRAAVRIAAAGAGGGGHARRRRFEGSHDVSVTGRKNRPATSVPHGGSVMRARRLKWAL